MISWRLEDWFISGVHTGWRIVRGAGWNAEYDSGYAYDRYKEGDEHAKLEAATKRLDELNA